MKKIFLAAWLLLWAGVSAAAPVNVQGGLVEGDSEGGLTVCRGIPFAAPPVGDLRWRAPQPAAKWEGVSRADKFAPACVQGGPPGSPGANQGLGISEDCLYLNVWTPAQSAQEHIPVLVWIHGGGFAGGAASIPTYSGEKLAKRGVVLVSIAYRVGADVPYVFEHLDTPNRQAAPGDQELSETMAAYWTDFAKRGDPNGGGLPNWPAFSDAHPVVMYLKQPPRTGPVPSAEGLKGLEAYFAWRRTPEGEAAVRPKEQTTLGTPPTGIAAKRPVFGGACKICPWGAMAEVVQAAMKPYGYDVQICYNCNGAEAPRIVSEAKLPPPYKPDAAVPEILAPRNVPGLGPVDFGAVAVQFLRSAYRGTGIYAKEKPRTNLRLIANIQDPSYVLVAAKAETGITDLSQIREKRWPIRILSAGIGSNSSTILAYFGLSREAIEAAGGRVGNTPEDRENFDVAIGGGGVMTTAPEWRIWTEISQKFDLNFIPLPDDLLAKLAQEGEQERGIIPVGLYRGVVRPIPTVVRTGTVIYGRADMPDDFAYLVAKAMDEQQDLLQWKHLNFSYNIHNVWKAYEVPLHPGAARYYKEQGYMK